jgi:hypothetical protein
MRVFAAFLFVLLFVGIMLILGACDINFNGLVEVVFPDCPRPAPVLGSFKELTAITDTTMSLFCTVGVEVKDALGNVVDTTYTSIPLDPTIFGR